MRILVLLSVLALSASAPAQEPHPTPPQGGVELESGVTVQVEGSAIVVREGEVAVFRATAGAWSTVTSTLVGTAAPSARAFSWNYPHLLDIVFVDLSVAADAGSIPAFTIDSAFEHKVRALRPHDGMGSHDPLNVETWQRQNEAGWIVVMRLDRARSTARGDGVWSFDAEPRRSMLRWPIAVVRASTRAELESRMGQAILAFDGAGSREDPRDWWRVPTLCGTCQQQQVVEVELDLLDRDSAVMLRARTRLEHPDHAGPAAEGLTIEGHALGRWFTGEQGNESWYVVPFGEPAADALVAVALSGDARVQVRLCNGRVCEAPVVRVQLDPTLQERLYERSRAREEAGWPNHLSSELVSSWPNPFHESTTIEITVPATIEEAFELEPELLARVEPTAVPPFGTNPSVQVKVYNVSGQLVNVLDSGPRTAGRFTVGWNGMDLQNRPVASGAYYVHVAMEEWTVTRRVLLLRN